MRKLNSTLASICALVAVALGITGCGGSASPTIKPPDRIQPGHAHTASSVVLTAVGAARIGVQTSPVRAAGANVVIPFSAIVYDPSGSTHAFVASGPLTFSEVPVTVDHVAGDSAFLLKGPGSGREVVTTGAEELFGVQTGVLAQT